MDQSFFNLCLGLLLLMGSNIALGSISSLFKQEFDFSRFTQGLLKAIIVACCFISFVYAGYLNPSIVAIDIDGKMLDFFSATKIAMMSSYVYYGKECFTKLIGFISGK